MSGPLTRQIFCLQLFLFVVIWAILNLVYGITRIRRWSSLMMRKVMMGKPNLVVCSTWLWELKVLTTEAPLEAACTRVLQSSEPSMCTYNCTCSHKIIEWYSILFTFICSGDEYNNYCTCTYLYLLVYLPLFSWQSKYMYISLVLSPNCVVRWA